VREFSLRLERREVFARPFAIFFNAKSGGEQVTFTIMAILPSFLTVHVEHLIVFRE
jgi:hypothetical protein